MFTSNRTLILPIITLALLGSLLLLLDYLTAALVIMYGAFAWCIVWFIGAEIEQWRRGR